MLLKSNCSSLITADRYIRAKYLKWVKNKTMFWLTMSETCCPLFQWMRTIKFNAGNCHSFAAGLMPEKGFEVSIWNRLLKHAMQQIIIIMQSFKNRWNILWCSRTNSFTLFENETLWFQNTSLHSKCLPGLRWSSANRLASSLFVMKWKKKKHKAT